MSKPIKIVLGVVALIAIVAGGLGIVVINLVDRGLEQMTDAVTVTHLDISPFAGGERWNLSVHLEVENPTSGPVDVTMKRIAVKADERDLGFAELMGPASVALAAGMETRFQGRTLISDSIYEDLKARGEITYTIDGEITVTDRFLWFSKSRTEPFSLELRGMVG